MSLFCFSLPKSAKVVLHAFSCLTSFLKAHRMSDTNRLKNSLFSLPASISSVAFSHSRYPLRVLRLYASPGGQGLCHVLVVESWHGERLHSASYGLEQQLRVLADEQEHRHPRWLLQQFQHLVGARQVHAFRQPYHAHLVSVERRLHVELPHQPVALSLEYHMSVIHCSSEK